jgi:hypothetical protein
LLSTRKILSSSANNNSITNAKLPTDLRHGRQTTDMALSAAFSKIAR